MTPSQLRQTHTYAGLEISQSAYDEIAGKLRDAGYDHAFDADTGAIDMHGIGLLPDGKPAGTVSALHEAETEICDLFARYGSGDYTPTQQELDVIHKALPLILRKLAAVSMAEAAKGVFDVVQGQAAAGG